MRAKAFGGTFTFAESVERGVEALPSLGGRHLAGGPRVFPRRRDGVDDRAATRGVAPKRHQVGKRPDVQLGIRRLNVQHMQEHSGGVIGVDAGVLQQLVDGHVEDARGVVGALDIATDPVQCLGVAGQHQRITACCCCCWAGCCSCVGRSCDCCCCWVGFSPSDSPLDVVTGLGSERTISAAPSSRLATEARDASTHVSLEPPPWLEFTTRDPSTRATRVRPPGNTHTSSPSLTANGRKSTYRGVSLSSTCVGTVESCIIGCAIQPRGSSRIFLLIAFNSLLEASGPKTMP